MFAYTPSSMRGSTREVPMLTCRLRIVKQPHSETHAGCRTGTGDGRRRDRLDAASAARVTPHRETRPFTSPLSN